MIAAFFHFFGIVIKIPILILNAKGLRYETYGYASEKNMFWWENISFTKNVWALRSIYHVHRKHAQERITLNFSESLFNCIFEIIYNLSKFYLSKYIISQNFIYVNIESTY